MTGFGADVGPLSSGDPPANAQDGASAAELRDGAEKVAARYRELRAKPLTVAIMGQTGVGKSSLLNAMFGAELEVGDARPTTKEPTPVTVRGRSGHEIVFWDLPGIGESETADAGYHSIYARLIRDCDVALWACHVDNRSTLLDVRLLDTLLVGLGPAERGALLAKLTFVLTKADLVVGPAWIYAYDGRSGSFAPPERVTDRLAARERYFEEVLIAPYAEELTSRTYVGGRLPGRKLAVAAEATGGRIDVAGRELTYRGYFSDAVADALRAALPAWAEVWQRLRENHRVITCSSVFRYDLSRLLSVVVNKLGWEAVARFEDLITDGADLDAVPLSRARSLSNVLVWDVRSQTPRYDLSTVDID